MNCWNWNETPFQKAGIPATVCTVGSSIHFTTEPAACLTTVFPLPIVKLCPNLHGYAVHIPDQARHQRCFMQGVHPIKPDQTMAGHAFTLRYIPSRRTW